jgi:hypothetical protein
MGAAIMAWCLAACATTDRDEGSFHFELTSYNGSMGYLLDYDVDGRTLTVTFRGDLEGERPKVLLSRSLSDRQRQTFVRGVEATAWRDMRQEHVSDVLDGLDLTINVSLDGDRRSFRVHHVYDEQIAQLVDLVDALLPEDLKVEYRKLKEEEEDLKRYREETAAETDEG